MELKGDFYINEIEYLAPATVYERGKPASEIIHNNVKEFVEHEQYCLIHCGTNQYLLRKDKRRLNSSLSFCHVLMLAAFVESIVSRTLYYKQYLNLNPKDEDRPHSTSSWFYSQTRKYNTASRRCRSRRL